MGGRIDCYLDVVSFYSYVGFADLRMNLDKLAAHGVEVDFHPVFLGGINHLSGNKPPWILPAKAVYLSDDSSRAAARLSLPYEGAPKDLMAMAKNPSPLRALHFIKANYPLETFLSAFAFLFHRMWTPLHVNLVDDANLTAALAEATETPTGGKKLFSAADVDKIMTGRESMKERVKQLTGEAVERGAFGAPWLWVTNDEGKTQAFFGSDRFNHIYHFLGVPFQDIAVLPPSKL
ncbi:thioredoxin-like protein [Dactylonectria estremocensis]|uniref:Glutathione S-transferase kappa 1 n=1 Tax=Dactylonectria estremocensis TaxID=1079267 RepID=A0A9P9JI52_9HYPO|nr:thioredoxin-like protein [Dactylonectria estremocensis]